MPDREAGIHLLENLAEGRPGVVLITGKRAAARFGLEGIAARSKFWISKVPPNPTVADLFQCLSRLEGQSVNRLICIGGGSTIDLGKALRAFLGGGCPDSCDSLRQAIIRRAYSPGTADLVAVPTTAGTGADLTPWATVWDMQNHQKLSVDSPWLAPELSLIIPEFTLRMPERLSLSTGLDALAQAMEAFWANSRDPLSQTLALEAIRHIADSLPHVLEDPENLTYRRRMCLGALLSGLAFSRTRTTACHSISYPITMRYGVEHGLAAAVTLEAVARLNREAVPEIDRIYKIFGGEAGLHQWLDMVTGGIQPLRLSAMGVPWEGLDQLAAEAFTVGRMDNNPVLLGQDDVKEILSQVF